MILELDANLSHYAGVIKKSLRIDVNRVPGAGAAGGMGAALMAFLGAELKAASRLSLRRSILKNIFTIARGC